MSNFWSRTITGLSMVFILLAALWFSGWVFAGIFFLITLFGMKEFYGLVSSGSLFPQKTMGIIAGAVIFAGSAVLFLLPEGKSFIPLPGREVLPFLLPLPFIFLVILTEIYRNKPNPLANIAITVLGFLYIALPLSLLTWFNRPGTDQFLGFPVIMTAYFGFTWINDTAADCIRLGRADMIVAGGSEAAVTAAGVGGFNAMNALSERNDSPQTASRPFDVDRDGFVLGEGAGALILEEYEHAVRRGATIYAEYAGGGMSADAYHMTAPHPDGLGAQLVMRDAFRDANLKAEDIQYVNVHGTSTPIGDPQEIKAIQSIFGEHAYQINISSTKSMTGHLLGAAGAIEAIASIMALNNGVIPPTINHFTDDPVFDTRLNLTFNKAQNRELNAVLSNTFGFGGHNASVIFKKLSN